MLEQKKLYFIGIGGIGMSAIAGIAAANGWEVKGSDSLEIYEPSKGVLERFKIPYIQGYAQKNIEDCFAGKNPELVVVTTAVNQDNPEVRFAMDNNLKIISYPEALNLVVGKQRQIVVVGTHGKGTTSGLISYALRTLHDSSFFVGGVLIDYDSNFYWGKGPDMTIEGDEYISSVFDQRPKFIQYKPSILLINNIEFDHPDIYPTIEDVKNAFKFLVKNLDSSAIIVYNADDQNILEVVKDSLCKKIGFGLRAGDYQAGESQLLPDLSFAIPVYDSAHKEIFSMRTQFPGELYAYDFLAAFATLLCAYPETDLEQLQEIFASFHGIRRRYEMISAGNRITIIDDYAHHPTAVRKTIEATRAKFPKSRIVCFFEPHTYSRTKETLSGLATAFTSANQVFIAEVYPARERRLPSGIKGAEVVAAIKANQPNTQLVATKTEALNEYLKISQPGDVVLIMAVGSFNLLAYDIKIGLS
jgi:UDP-N-acetylmuramate: L-alanyl-gamma-D-glutamyl-meso-diaminopimelate ligase